MSNKPLFSIITVTFNVEDTIQKTIDSVNKQSFEDYEYLVIDGKSTDKTLDIIKRNEDKIDKWISEKDEGIYNAMNKGASMANGKYLFFLNSGDYFFNEDVLEDVAKHISDEDMVYGSIEVYFEGRSTKFVKDVTLTKANVKLGKKVSQQAVFVKRSVFEELGGLDERFKIASDFDLLCKLFENDYHIKKANVIISQYEGGEGVSSDLRKSYDDTGMVIKERYGKFYYSLYFFITRIKLLIAKFILRRKI